MRLKMTWVVVCALAGGLIAAGCGGDDDNSDSTDNGATTAVETLSKSAFIQEADQICKEGNDQIDQAGKSLGGNPSDAEIQSFIDETVAPNVENQLDQIRALGIPEGDEAQVNAILDAAQEAVDKIKSDPSVITDNGPDPFAEANKLAKEYGLSTCGNG